MKNISSQQKCVNNELVVMFRRILMSLILLFSLPAAWGAEPFCSVTRYDNNSFLQNNTPTDIVQDKDGLLWISTWNGLLSYDGYSFTHFIIASETGQLMGNNRINDLDINSFGDIYCHSNDNRIYLFHPRTHRFTDISRMADLPEYFRTVHSFPLAKGVTWMASKGHFCFRIDEKKLYANDSCIQFFTSRFQCNDVFDVFQDSKEKEWILTDNGTYILGEDFLHLPVNYQYHVAFDGKIWLASKDGEIIRHDPAKPLADSFAELKEGLFLRHKEISFLSSLGNFLAIGTSEGVFLMEKGGVAMRKITLSSSRSPIGIPLEIYQDKMGEIWIFGTRPGILRTDTFGRTHYYPPLPKTKEMEKSLKFNRPFFFEDFQDNLWMVTQGGSLCYYDRCSDCLRFHYTDPNNPLSIVSFPNRFQFQDHQGNWWICSDSGLKRLTLHRRFYDLIPVSEDEFGVRAMMTDHQGCLWTATRGGLVRIFNSQLVLEGYLSKTGSILPYLTEFHPNVYDMMEDSKHRIWIATKGEGVYLLDNGTVRHFTNEKEDKFSLAKDNVYCIFEDSHHHIWVGCHGDKGLNLVEELSDGTIRFINANNRLKNYPDYYGDLVRFINETSDGVLLVGSTTGLICFDSGFTQPEEISFHCHVQEKGNMNSLCENDVIDIACPHDGSAYLATHFGGIDKIDSSSRLLQPEAEFQHFNEIKAQRLGQLSSIIIDDDGQIWAFSSNSFSKISPKTKTITRFESSSFSPDGIGFLENASLLLANGRIAAGSNQGIFLFDPKELRKSDYSPPLLITGLTAGDKEFPWPADTAEICLLPNQLNLTFRFTAIDYSAENSIQYAYRLKGLEQEWHEVQNNRTATYFNLPTGYYCFQVRSTNGDGVWANNLKEIYFYRQPAFWESGWKYPAYAIIVLLSAGLLVGIPYMIIRLRRKWLLEAEQRKTLQSYCLSLLEQQKQYQINCEGEKEESVAECTQEPPILSLRDQQFMEQVKSYIDRNIDNSNLIIDDLAEELGLSRTVLYKKTKSLFGFSPVLLVRHLRIVRAAQLIDEGNRNFSEISYLCGFNNPNYFSTCFKEQMGMSPSEYRSRNRKTSE